MRGRLRLRLYGPQPAIRLAAVRFSELVGVANGWEPTISIPGRAIAIRLAQGTLSEIQASSANATYAAVSLLSRER